MNRRFVAELRRQLLLWRTIPSATRDRYIDYGRRLLDNADAPCAMLVSTTYEPP